MTRAFDRHLRRSVARKAALHRDAASLERLIHEARLLAYLDHPGAVTVYDVDPATGTYSMKLLSGDTLKAGIRALGEARMPVKEALRIIRRICETMANAQDKGVLHLDLKPSNILLGNRSEVTVIDWGLARFHDRTQYDAELKASSEPIDLETELPLITAGTLAYMPVEQMFDPDQVGPTADIFAVGTMLYELLAGVLPFPTHGTPIQIAYRKVELLPPAPSSLNADVPASLDELCAKMLASDPHNRPASFDVVLRALDGVPLGERSLAPHSLEPGEVLFTMGDPADVAWQVLAGRVSLSVAGANGETHLGERTVGDVIGEMGLITGRPRSATVRAVEPTTVRPIRSEDVEFELGKVNPLVAHLVRKMSDRIRKLMPEPGDL